MEARKVETKRHWEATKVLEQQKIEVMKQLIEKLAEKGKLMMLK